MAQGEIGEAGGLFFVAAQASAQTLHLRQVAAGLGVGTVGGITDKPLDEFGVGAEGFRWMAFLGGARQALQVAAVQAMDAGGGPGLIRAPLVLRAARKSTKSSLSVAWSMASRNRARMVSSFGDPLLAGEPGHGAI